MKYRAVALVGALAIALVGPANAAEAKGPTLGPYGYGKLKLGQTAKQAYKTKLIVAKGEWPDAALCTGFDLKKRPTPKDAVGGYLSKKVGVAAIFAVKGLKTPRGVTLGSTRAQVKKAYPRSHREGNLWWITVPGNKKALYLFSFDAKNRVAELTLALKTQDCFN